MIVAVGFQVAGFGPGGTAIVPGVCGVCVLPVVLSPPPLPQPTRAREKERRRAAERIDLADMERLLLRGLVPLPCGVSERGM